MTEKHADICSFCVSGADRKRKIGNKINYFALLAVVLLFNHLKKETITPRFYYPLYFSLNFMKWNFSYKIYGLFLLFCLSAWHCNISKIRPEHIEMRDLEGNVVQWSDARFKDKTILLNFWATWCPPCNQEKPLLEAARRELEPLGYQFVVLSDEKTEKLQHYRQRHDDYGFLYCQSPKSIKMYGVLYIPQTYIIKNGKVVAEFGEGQQWNSPEMLAALKAFL